MMHESFVAIDMEYTGRAGKDRQPLQLGLVEVVDGEVTARHCYWFRVLGHPWDTISWSHTLHDKHGGKLDRTTYERAPFLVDARSSIAAVIAGRPVFIYNAGTDMTYLRAAFDAHGAPWPRLDYACAYSVAQTVWGAGEARVPGRLSPRLRVRAGSS